MNARALLFIAGSIATPLVYAVPVGTSITVSDNNFTSSGWYGNHEDNETEILPNTLRAQSWDLEGMFLNGQTLSMVGGFNFLIGTKDPLGRYQKSGDIFIDINGDAKYGQNASGSPQNSGTNPYGSLATTSNSFGWDYVIHFNSVLSGGLTQIANYSVFSIDSTSLVKKVTDVPSSNPWVWESGGTAVAGYQNRAFGYGSIDVTGLSTFGSSTIEGYGTDNNHYFLSTDIGFLAGQDATFHYTIECGNDNLVGQASVPTVPDSGSTLLFISGGLVLLFAARRRFL
jgi:hypothetical protein